MTIGNNIAKIRTIKKWTQKELAKATGLSIGYISAIEEGRVRPRIKTLAIIANALEVDLIELYNK